MAQNRVVRIGCVGVGGMGQIAHLRNYVAIDGCEVAAIAELRPKLAERAAKRYGVEKVYGSHAEMLDSEQLDGVVAIQPFDLHAKLLPEVYPRVKHLLTEKPLAVSVSGGRALATAAAEAGCVHMVGYHKRSDPATEYARQVIDTWRADGRMGQMQYVRITMPAGDWTGSAFSDLMKSDEPCGPLDREPESATGLPAETHKKYVAFVNYYIHQMNLLRHLLSEGYRVTYAEPSGVLLAAESDTGIPAVIEMTPYRTTLDWHESALVAFETGYVKLDLPAPLATYRAGRVEVYTDPGGGEQPRHEWPVMPPVHAMRRQAENFVAVCRGDMPPPCDAAEAVEDLLAAEQYIRLCTGH